MLKRSANIDKNEKINLAKVLKCINGGVIEQWLYIKSVARKLLLVLLALVLLWLAVLLPALFAVVLHLYDKDYCTAQAGYGIGYEH